MRFQPEIPPNHALKWGIFAIKNFWPPRCPRAVPGRLSSTWWSKGIVITSLDNKSSYW